MKTRKRTKGWFALLALAAAGVAGCEDAGTGTEGGLPAGLVVENAQGSQVAVFNGTSTIGSIALSVGATQTFRVHLVDRAGARISVGGRYTLRPLVVIGTLASVSLQGADELRITGRAVGNTSLIVTVLDGAAAVFTADPTVQLTVR